MGRFGTGKVLVSKLWQCQDDDTRIPRLETAFQEVGSEAHVNAIWCSRPSSRPNAQVQQVEVHKEMGWGLFLEHKAEKRLDSSISKLYQSIAAQTPEPCG